MFRTKKQIKAISDRLENFINYHNDMVRKFNKLVKLNEDLAKEVVDLTDKHNTLSDVVIDIADYVDFYPKKPAKKAAKKATNKKGK